MNVQNETDVQRNRGLIRYCRGICVEISTETRVSMSIRMSIDSRTKQSRITSLSRAKSVGRAPNNFSTGNTNACGSRPATCRAAVDVNVCAMRNASISSALDSRGSASIEFIFRRAAVYLPFVSHNEL
jgi:hypothetical protein